MTDYGIPELKRLLMTSVDLSVVQEYFLGNLIESTGFSSLGHALQDQQAGFFRDAFLRTYAARYPGVKTAGLTTQLVKVPEFKMVHGTILVNGMLTTLLYFEDMQMGMFSIAEGGQSGKVTYARFSRHRSTSKDPILSCFNPTHTRPN